MPNELIVRNGFTSQGNSFINGTLSVTGNTLISGKTITTNFQMTSGATTTGYVLTDSDGNGNAQWRPISGITGSSLMSTFEINVST